MRTSKLKQRLSLLLASLLASLALCSCNIPIHVEDATTCTAAGLVVNGGLCSHLISTDTCTLTYLELLDLIEAHPNDRTCVTACGLPVCADDQSTGVPALVKARGASIIMTPADWGQEKEELDEACRDLGKSCTLEESLKIQGMQRALMAP